MCIKFGISGTPFFGRTGASGTGKTRVYLDTREANNYQQHMTTLSSKQQPSVHSIDLNTRWLSETAYSNSNGSKRWVEF